jgi:hypothetical protein
MKRKLLGDAKQAVLESSPSADILCTAGTITCKAATMFLCKHTNACRLVADRLGLKEGVDYTRLCLGTDFKRIVSNLVNLADYSQVPRCDIGASGITETQKRRQYGIEFSKPTHVTRLRVLVQGSVTDNGRWAFLRPLEPSLWLAFLLTLLCVPSFIFFFEYWMSGRCESNAGQACVMWLLMRFLCTASTYRAIANSARTHNLQTPMVQRVFWRTCPK